MYKKIKKVSIMSRHFVFMVAEGGLEPSTYRV